MNRSQCGEEIEMALEVRDEEIVDAGFVGNVCSVAQTTASLLTAHLIGRSVSDAVDAITALRRVMCGESDAPELGDMVLLARVARFPSRVSCVLMVCRALERALKVTSREAKDEQH